ncbi:MAG: type II/IV secretion system ATPase subunit [Candidatus Bathyarchaeota archaeon]|nr:MAG: type II/IV secretion system ATPase subunit [Candidatus Bathyarchaeota archaeon]
MQKREQLPTFIENRKPSAFQEVYSVREPYVYAAIVKEAGTQKLRYEAIEPTLLNHEQDLLRVIKEVLMDEVDVSLTEIDTKQRAAAYLKRKTQEAIKHNKFKISEVAADKLMYYVLRDFVYYGKIDPLMNDHMIEDISADGVNIPIYVWHRKYESIPTNITFTDAEQLDSFIIRLAYLSRKNVSIASPILDASLPDGSRIQLTYGNEVTRRGSTFTIRRFRTDPLTITDLITLNTVSLEMAAYFWYIIENRASVLVAGGVASGKTTTLNCLSMFIKPEMKIVSVEDTAELNLLHENWIPSVVRTGFAGSHHQSAITLFDLLKTAVRQRPDFIIVGEVRGREAYTLFQAMATGHLGMSTIHGESAEAVLSRLEAEPMNIPKPLLTMIDCLAIQIRTEIDGKPARRASSVTEILALDSKSGELLTQNVFEWNPTKDSFDFKGNSWILERSKKKRGVTEEYVQNELLRRKTVLKWMVKKGIRKYTDVAHVIREYYATPDRLYRKARMDLK